MPVPVLSRVTRGLASARRGLAFATAILREPVTPESAAAAVRTRLAERPAAFLHTLERVVFAHPASPYRQLLEGAGYTPTRLREMVHADGVEATLERLCADRVYVAIEEFKGLREARRGDRSYRLTPADFDNPLLPRGLVASSGGTRSRGIPTTISAQNLRMGAEHLALAISAYGLLDVPVVVWLATGHGASLWAVVALAAMRKAPPRWFAQLAPPSGVPEHLRPFQLALRGRCRLHGIGLPTPTHVPLADPSPILRWIVEDARRGCGVLTTPSSALRLALAARHAGVRLDRVSFITIGEPLTRAKLAGIEAAGARAYSSLGFTEFGRATYGCAARAGTDETHVCRDLVAVVRRPRAVEGSGRRVDALLFTALRASARKVLLNVETGDYAATMAGRCGCVLETVGWSDRLERIRSFEKLNAEGGLLFGSDLIGLVEKTLPRRLGGDPTDYQLLEEEDRDGFTRLSVLVHPRLGPVDEAAVVDCLRETLRRTPGAPVNVWREAETVRVRRQAPVTTSAGKLLPLHHLGPENSAASASG